MQDRVAAPPIQRDAVLHLVREMEPAVAEEVGVDPFARGVLVTKIGGGPAQMVGLQPGDIVRAVNGRKVESVADLAGAVTQPQPVWQLTIERNGQLVTATVRG